MKKKKLISYKERDRAMVRAIVGANWGDEGKGKITDMLAETSDIIVRFQGGSNAGHTIINNYGKFALHLLPSGVFYGHTTSIIGNGVALNIPYLVKEINSLIEKGVPKPKVLVSDRAQIIMPYHIKFDEYEEERLGKNSFGSTKSGIAPFYSDKYAKIGFQVSELFDDEILKEKIERVCIQKDVLLEHLYHKPAIDKAELLETLHEYRDMIAPYVCDTALFIQEAIKAGKTVLLEGQLGTLKDPDFGIYPMVTSSSTLASYGAIGAGIPPYEIKDIIAVVKAYSSAVGAGEFVSEIFGEEADELRHRGGDGGEYGATTGRPRRMGWFDAVASRYGVRMQGATQVSLTVLDVLGYLGELPICVGYEIDGKVTRDFPVTAELKKAKPVYEKLPGWKCEIKGIRKYEELPENCRKYIEFIEKELGVPVTMVSNGPGREDIIYKK
jgi:adenylosuccinate synthase